MKIVFISELHKGGVEKVNSTLAENLIKRGINAYIISINGIVGGDSNELIPDYCISLYQKKKSSIIPLTKALKRIKPEIIVVTSILDALLVIIYKCLYCNTKIIYVQHSVYSIVSVGGFKKKVIYRLIPNLIRLFDIMDGIVFVSKGVQEDFKNCFKYYKARSIVIYNPITSNTEFIYKKIDQNRVKLVTAGRLEEEKDQKTIIRAVKLLKDRGIDVSLTIFGTGTHENELQMMCNEFNIQRNVFFPGYTNNLQEQLREFDIFILSSLHESFGNVIVEAMNVGIPVISTNCPVGPKEILSDGVYGSLIPIQDPDSLADEIIKVLHHWGYDSAKRSYKRSLDFSVEASTNEYIDFFSKIIQDE